MSYLVPSQEEKVTSMSQWHGKLPVDHEIPPQSQQNLLDTEVASHLVPLQEEKRDFSNIGKSSLDKGLDRLKQELDSRSIRDELQSRDELARNKQIAGSVLAGAASVTGEDLGVAENKWLV
ncbi:hypothetical protein WOLCODRAFT_148620 [Wolfiporia cocos MD-104 SS10]|uniref:Uncharacterized protein n=1 Tax=Wolfiporia cocos (strain MD-104) TaxID=742152 RepID=A0A2H3J6W5_WOLCO|nr:hypothetical protein WOLCODRAFT_148620 [Wolfiporia cocos MD-104 SS10]